MRTRLNLKLTLSFPGPPHVGAGNRDAGFDYDPVMAVATPPITSAIPSIAPFRVFMSEPPLLASLFHSSWLLAWFMSVDCSTIYGKMYVLP